jgi:hypothetical protein
MNFDKRLMFSDAQNLAVGVGTTLCDRSVPVGAPGTVPFQSNSGSHDAGLGSPLEVCATVTEAFDSAGDDTTLKVQLVSADDETLSTNLTVLHETRAFAQADLTLGARLPICELPPGITRNFLGLAYVTGTSTATAGKVTAGITSRG